MMIFPPDTAWLHFPEASPIRIFAATEPLGEVNAERIQSEINAFLAQWKAHGTPLEAEAGIYLDRFVIVAVNEKSVLPSGCSLDALFRFIVSLEAKLSIELTDRKLLYFYTQEGSVETCPFTLLADFEVRNKKVFHLLCTTVGEIKRDFLLDPEQSAYARLFSK